MDATLEQLDRDGYAEMRGVFDAATVDSIIADLSSALATAHSADSVLHSEDGVIYAARNVLELWPRTVTAWRVPRLFDALATTLGSQFGLARALFFDKPPGHSWTLPFHKDLTIAVRDNSLPSKRFVKPTRKAGIPHVEAPLEVLEGMLTARIHLDHVAATNGPLRVLPGSHKSGKTLTADGCQARTLFAARGDVLLMRPLLAHGSGRSTSTSHRRVLHLEFASTPDPGDGFVWHDFVPGGQESPALASFKK
jgi:hypothetical protein